MRKILPALLPTSKTTRYPVKNQPHHPHRPLQAHPHTEATLLLEAVAAYAHELWCRHGHTADRDDAIWLDAAMFIFVLTPLLHSIHP